MFKDIKEFIKNCKTCNIACDLKKNVLPLQPIKINARFERIGIDLTGPFVTSSQGNKYILVVTEYYTKWAEAFPIPDKSAYTVAKTLFLKFFCRYGCVEMISSDQGTEFNNHLQDLMLKFLNIKKKVSMAYHPQTNGLTERFNKTIIKMISKHVSESQTDWDDL